VSIDQAEITKRFTYHALKGDQPQRYADIRKIAFNFADSIVLLTPTSREQSLALTALNECVFWANAAIARNE
jgi:hypothetical protein